MKDIQWLDWGKDSFEKSRSTGKPILLDITGSWCHWCHVMDKTSYSDPAVIDTVSKHFIPVRVDTDKRPDVNRRYNMGGWPTTAFLDSEGHVITGGTYIPPQQLREVLRSVLDHYAKHGGRARSKLEPIRLPKATNEQPTDRITKDIATSIAVNFDIDYGGFGFEPKFPHTDALDFALLRYKYAGEREMLTVVTRTLEKMAKGGIYDQVEDGFFRYSTTRDWSIPHFEKMAEDNAKLLAVYLRAFQITQNPLFKQVADGIIRYVTAKLSDPESGGFFGSQDADEEYYKLGLEARQKTAQPSVDKTLCTNFNAYFVSSLLSAAVVLDRADLGAFALKTLDRFLNEAWTEYGLLHYLSQEPRTVSGLLLDHVSLLQALLDAYEFTSKTEYLDKAHRLADLSLKTLLDGESGGFFDIPEKSAELGELKTRDKPLDENSAMALALLRLSDLTGKEVYGEIAGKTLSLFQTDYERYGLMAGGYAVALDRLLNGPVSLAIIGSRKGKEFASFKLQALRVYPARRSILYLDPTKDFARMKDLGYESSGKNAAYVCVGKVCGPPVKDAAQIQNSVESLIKPNGLQPIA